MIWVTKSSLYTSKLYYVDLYMHTVCHLECTTVHDRHMQIDA